MTDLFLGYPDEGITNWIKENCVDYSKIPLCFEALEDGNVKLTQYDNPDKISLLYSFDNKTWHDWDYATGTDLKTSEKLYIKSSYDNGKFSISTFNGYYNFSTTGKVNVAGNIMSLLYNNFVDKATLTSNYCFVRLFIECTNLINASNLILQATTLTDNCYDSMFASCSNLILGIKLPATDITGGCYENMFQYCLNISELHYPKSIENDSTFKSIYNSPYFGATNATVYYDL